MIARVPVRVISTLRYFGLPTIAGPEKRGNRARARERERDKEPDNIPAFRPSGLELACTDSVYLWSRCAIA